MLNIESVKHNNIFAFTNAKNATLSDRLKQAGIKEMKPPKQNKKGKKEKPDPKKYIFSKDYLDNNCRNTAEIKKKGENQSPDEILPVSGRSSQSEEPRVVTSLKNSKCLSEFSEKNIEEKVKETVLVSMDFIEDVQKYKKKIRSPKDSWELKYDAYVKDECSNSKIVSPKKKEVTKQHNNVKIDNNTTKGTLDETKSENEGYLETEKNVEKENLSKRKSQTEKEPATNFQLVQPFLNKLSSDDTAKIDKSYIRSLLTVARYKGKDQKRDSESKKSEESIANEEQTEKRTKISGKTYFNRKIKRKKTEAEGDSKRPAAESPDREDLTFDKEPTTLLVRDFTKSEEIQKESSLDRKGKPKTLNVTHSKPAVITTRRKRKFRHNFLKKADKEFIETSFPGENLRAADVKELWRRESSEKSENSLSSHSSCTAPESDDSPDWKNLGLDSYKILKKLVEEEVKKISKKSENKDNKENVKNKTNSSSLNEELKVKNCVKTLTDDTKTESTKKPVLEVFDSMKKKAELFRRFAEDIPKEPDLKLKSLEEKAKTKTKIPSKVIQDWNILNRLEQAFVALGSPSFPAKASKEANATKVKKSSPQTSQKNDSSSQKILPDHLKDGKKATKKKDSVPKKGKKDSKIRQVSSNTKTGKETTEKKTRKLNQQNKKIDINNKISVLRERLQGNTSKKESERKLTQRNPVTKYKESNSKQKSNSPKVSLKSFKATIATTLKQETIPSSSKSGQSRSRLLPAKIKLKKRYKTNSKNVEETLERKITYDIISGEAGSVPPLRSESFIKVSEDKIQSLEIENNEKQIIDLFELDLKKKKLSKTKFQTKAQVKKETEAEIKEEMEVETTSNKKETDKEDIIPVPLNPTEDPMPLAIEKPEEKMSENLMKILNTEPDLIPESLYSCKKNDKKKTFEELSQPEQPPRKELKSSSTDKVLKKRSILSVQTSPSLRFLQIIQEKNDLDGKPDNDFNVDLCKKITQNDLKTFYEICKRSYSNTSISSTGTNDLSDVGKNVTNSPQDKKFENPCALNESSFSSCNLEERLVDQNRGEFKTTKNQSKMSWEQDIRIYRAIVTDILRQYNRINGFLKQNKCLNSLTADNSMSATTSESKKNHFDDPQIKNNLTEYRKKIIMEYKALPIFEYKTIQSSQWEDVKKKNLVVAKDLKRGIDFDVKDYEMNVQTVLDPQLKQQESFVQSKGNGKEKNISLQEIMLCGGEKAEKEEKQLRSSSTTKTFHPLLTLNSTKKLPSKESISNLASFSVTTCYPDTESESC